MKFFDLNTTNLKSAKFCILLSLAVASAYGQLAPAGGEAAPEPYSYGYETDTHAAAEQKDPNGRVTGYYTLSKLARLNEFI